MEWVYSETSSVCSFHWIPDSSETKKRQEGVLTSISLISNFNLAGDFACENCSVCLFLLEWWESKYQKKPRTFCMRCYYCLYFSKLFSCFSCIKVSFDKVLWRMFWKKSCKIFWNFFNLSESCSLKFNKRDSNLYLSRRFCFVLPKDLEGTPRHLPSRSG